MADRKDAYFLQLVGEAFWDENLDGLEDADRLLAVDMGFVGIVSGVVTTEHVAPPDLTVDITAGVSYDQAGRRCGITSAENGFNCAVDENAVATAVAAPGNERWLSIQLRFDRTLTDLQVDGNGNNVFVDQDESYELAVVMGPEQAAGTGLGGPGYTGRPALPADGRLVCDAVLLFGTTQIFNADINTDRRQDFSIFSAAAIPVASGGWAWLNPATDDVQSSLDFIDDYVILTDVSREVLQNLLPDVPSRHLGGTGQEWDAYLLELVMVAASRVDGNLLPKVNGNDLGALAGPLRWSLFCDLFNMDGDMVTSAGTRVDGNLLPKAAANDLGSVALPWDLFLRVMTTDASTRVDGNLWPDSTGMDLGSATLRWDVFSEAITHYGVLAGTFVFDAAEQAVLLANVNDFLSVGGTDWAWNSTRLYVTCSVSAKVGHFYFDVPHGVSLDKVEIRWSQAAVGGGGMTAQIESIDEDNAASNVGASKTIAVTDGTTNWDAIDSGLAEVVDLLTTSYRVKVTTVANALAHNVYKLRLTYNITDILKAALYQS